MAKIFLEQLKRKQYFIFEEFMNFQNFPFLFSLEKKKKYSYTLSVNKKECFFLEKRGLTKNNYAVPLYSIKNSKIYILESVLDKKIIRPKANFTSIKSIGLSCILKKIKGGLLLNSASSISFIPFSFYEEKLNSLGKNVYLELIKLKLLKYDHKFFFSSLGTRKSLLFKFRAVFKNLVKKRLVYKFFPSEYKKVRSLHTFCRYNVKLKIKVVKEIILSF